jgi:AcrR family transcriptional regulator
MCVMARGVIRASSASAGRIVPTRGEPVERGISAIAPPLPTVDALAEAFPSGLPNENRNAQRMRRARILAGARTLIASGGVENVKIRALSEISDLSIQTIYNLVGNREDVIEAAVVEHVWTVTRNSKGITDGYPNVLLALSDTLWANLFANSDYYRGATLGCSYKNFQLYKNVRKRTAIGLQRLLSRHYGDVAKSKRIDLVTLAADITSLVSAIALEWAEGLIPDAHVRYRLACAYGRFVVLLCSDDERSAIYLWLDGIKPRGV